MIYLDNAATVRVLDEVLEEHARINRDYFANAGSHHYFGYQAKNLLEEARTSILKDLKLEKTHKVMFNSGATEGNNTVLKGLALKYANRGKRILVGPTEHPSILTTANDVARLYGFEVVKLPVDESGRVTPEILSQYMDKQTLIVSIMAVNNETGAINDLKALSEVVKQYPKCFFHSDATQGIGKVDIDYSGVYLLTFSGHKIGAFKGSGALIYHNRIGFESLHSGGSQEGGFRAGTVDVPSCVCLAKALHLCFVNQKAWGEHVRELNNHLRDHLKDNPLISINSLPNDSPYVLNFSLTKHKASVVVEALSRLGIYVSSIAACSSKGEEPSYVLEAMGKPSWASHNPIRVSFNHETSLEEVNAFVNALEKILQEVRPL